MAQGEVHLIVMKTNTMNVNSDPFPTNIIKLNLDILIPIIPDLVNKSLTSGEFPKDQKMSIMKLLFKKGTNTNFPTIDPTLMYLSC